MTPPLSPTVVRLLVPGVLRSVGGTLESKLAEDSGLREKERRRRLTLGAPK